MTKFQLAVLKKAHKKISWYFQREDPPTISELLLFMSSINEYSIDDPNAKTVNMEHLTEIMTDFYKFGPTENILAKIQRVNKTNETRCDLKLLSKIVNSIRERVFECE